MSHRIGLAASAVSAAPMLLLLFLVLSVPQLLPFVSLVYLLDVEPVRCPIDDMVGLLAWSGIAAATLLAVSSTPCLKFLELVHLHPQQRGRCSLVDSSLC
jgi:hypothetical protein